MPDDGARGGTEKDCADMQTEAPRPHLHDGPHHHARPPRHLALAAAVLLLAAAGAATAGIVIRAQHAQALTAWTNGQADPTVSVAHPQTGEASRTLTLPGEVAAYYEAPIYARVSGYLQSWSQDIGAHVKAGQTLAIIDTPELDEELSQARADLASARANEALASLTAKRWHALLATNSVSEQSADEKAGSEVAARAAVAAQQAHVDRLLALQSFKRLSAPFNGVVTARNTDIGALINAGSGAAHPLFKVADVHAMRIYVRIPQAYASQLVPGMQAELTQPQYPGQSFSARLQTTSQSVTMESRTVLAELIATNDNGKLWPGTYGEVRFDLPPDKSMLRVPASALIFRAQGAQLATLTPDHRIALKSVRIGRNLGNEIEIAGGLSAQDLVVTTPLDTLEDGEPVQTADTAQAAQNTQY
jgi:RND family efflux transporter MFP subunit